MFEAHYRAGDEVKGIRFGFVRREHSTTLFNRQRRAELGVLA